MSRVRERETVVEVQPAVQRHDGLPRRGDRDNHCSIVRDGHIHHILAVGKVHTMEGTERYSESSPECGTEGVGVDACVRGGGQARGTRGHATDGSARREAGGGGGTRGGRPCSCESHLCRDDQQNDKDSVSPIHARKHSSVRGQGRSTVTLVQYVAAQICLS